ELSVVAFERAPLVGGWSVAARVRYPDGAPIGLALPLRGSLVAADGAERVAAHDVGSVTIDLRGVADTRVKLATSQDGVDLSADEAAQSTMTARLDVAGRVVEGSFRPRTEVRRAVGRARTALEKLAREGRPAAVADDVEATLRHLSDRLAHQVSSGDPDAEAEVADALALESLVAEITAGRDPIAGLRGPHRLAHVARADGLPQEVAVYIPASIDKLAPGKKLPLYVGLHGMNGGDFAMLRVFFGGDDEKQTMGELDRRISASGTIRDIDAFVVAPNGHGNAMFRQLGEVEVLDAIAWARKRWPQIDPDRVYVTGFSMGGIGAASIPLHHPDLFAAAEPLCGYHDYGIRRDIAGRVHRPWEDFLIGERSNVRWAENGLRLPLHIVHGTIDVPEENSGRLIERYEALKFVVDHEHPKVGHDVWGLAYDKLRQLDWFRGRRRDPHPRKIVFKTMRPRFGDDAWLHVDALARWDEWANIDATADVGRVSVTTKNVSAMHLDRDAVRIGAGKVRVTIDGAKIDFDAGAAIAMRMVDKKWIAGG
ncbi:MAG: prolyl oligopeptidase family serine peptidase, partial [Polyangiales bacterium]